MDRDLARVRLAARAVAALAFGAACVCLATMSRQRVAGEGPSYNAIFVSVVDAPTAPVHVTREAGGSQSALADDVDGEAPAVRLWNTDAAGRIVFASVDQLQRCREARMKKQDAADCPSAASDVPMIFKPNDLDAG